MRKNRVLTVFSIVICIALLFSLAACTKKYEFTVNDSGNLVNEKNGVTYAVAPECYEPIEISETVFAEQGERQFFEIIGADSSKWLCDTFGTVYYSSDIALPALSDMNVSYVDILEDGVVSSTVSDASAIEELRELYANGTEARYPGNAGMTPTVNLRMRFADRDSGICYVLAYYEYSEDYIFTDDSGEEINYGKCFFYNRATMQCISVSGLSEGVSGESK